MNIQLRNIKPGDEAIILELSQAADAVDRAERGLSASEVNQWLTVPGVQPEQDFFIAEADGNPVGVVGFDIQTGTLEKHRAFVGGFVHPEYRRRGIGAKLMEAVEARAAEKMRDLPGGFARYFESFCRSTQADVAALFESRGMEVARYFFNMQRDLRRDLPDAPVPDGLLIREYRDEDDGATLAALNEAFADHWGHEPLSVEEWKHFLRGVPHFRSELWLLAWAGNEIAGFTLNFVDPAYIQRVRRNEGIVGEVGVRRPWRKRGLATALVARSLHALRQAGMDYAMLGVDTENLTGAVGLYERLGFYELRRNVVYRKTA